MNTLTDDSDIVKPLNDNKAYRVIELKNGLKALLISDSRAQKSGVSLTVNAGSYLDTVPGLAHFCEHMLFLGSKRFPTAGDFDTLVDQHFGENNAFTEEEFTTYYFEIDSDAFSEAFAMFSDMFDQPLLNMDLMEKEINAVNSENNKNLQQDNWRQRQVLRTLANEEHPYSRFTTGNFSTLHSVPSVDLNKQLRNYFEKYYFPQAMRVVVIHKDSLDKIESAVASNFASFSRRPFKDNLNRIAPYGPAQNVFL